MATVRDVWEHALPQGTRVLAGSTRLDRPVSWALVLKPRPPGLEAAHGDEIVLLSTSTLPALDPALTLARALGSLADRVPAVAVRGDVDDDAICEAERLSLPLLQLPPGVAMVEIERNVLRYLSEERSEWYRRRHAILHELTALALEGKGLAAIGQHAGAMSGHAVLFEDEQGDTLAWYLPDTFPSGHRAEARAYVEGYTSLPEIGRGDVQRADELGKLSAPLLVNGQASGSASLLGPAAALDGEARLVLEAVATAGAIELTRQRAVQETVHRIQGDALSELLAGTGEPQELLRRVQRLGYDSEATYVTMAIHPAGDGQARDALHPLAKRLRRVLGVYELRAPFHIHDDLLTVFCPVEAGSKPAAWKRLAERLVADLADAAPRFRLFVGMSRARSGIEVFKTSYAEARRALELGHALSPDRTVTYFGDLGIYRLLFAMRETSEMHEFYNDMLGRLAEYDREKHSELIPTLDAYLSANNATEVAVRLNLHRNSLLYRLRRIREITGLDLDDPETRFSLHLALRVGEALRSEILLGA